MKGPAFGLTEKCSDCTGRSCARWLTGNRRMFVVGRAGVTLCELGGLTSAMGSRDWDPWPSAEEDVPAGLTPYNRKSEVVKTYIRIRFPLQYSQPADSPLFPTLIKTKRTKRKRKTVGKEKNCISMSGRMRRLPLTQIILVIPLGDAEAREVVSHFEDVAE